MAAGWARTFRTGAGRKRGRRLTIRNWGFARPRKNPQRQTSDLDFVSRGRGRDRPVKRNSSLNPATCGTGAFQKRLFHDIPLGKEQRWHHERLPVPEKQPM